MRVQIDSGEDLNSEYEEELDVTTTADVCESYSSELSDSSSESSNTNSKLAEKCIVTRHGVTWKKLSQARVGRVRKAAIFKGTPGVSRSAINDTKSPYTAWKLFIDEKILRQIYKCTLAEGKGLLDESFTMEKLEAFIALEYTRGIYGKNQSVNFLWNTLYGPHIFGETMSRKDYKDIKRCLRFDMKSTRSDRVNNDKFTHIRDIFDDFVKNCLRNYTPHYSLTVDEQLLPMKNRCPFIVYIPNKPDKFGIKFWILAEVNSKYVVNIIPYLGGQEKHSRNGVPLGENVVLKLTDPIKMKGYNVTTDNFFTSFELAKKLQEQQTSIVGTVRSKSKHLSKEMTGYEKGEKYKSKFFYEDDSGCLFVNYQCKNNKSVCLLSTIHSAPTISENDVKRKPEVINFYNKNKVGVDVLDQMIKKYSTHSATRRWPVAVWCNMLDIAIINSWILYRKTTGNIISRKMFIFKIIEDLRSAYLETKTKEKQSFEEEAKNCNGVSKKRRKCSIQKCNNATVASCRICNKPACGKCSIIETRVINVTCKTCNFNPKIDVMN